MSVCVWVGRPGETHKGTQTALNANYPPDDL